MGGKIKTRNGMEKMKLEKGGKEAWKRREGGKENEETEQI